MSISYIELCKLSKDIPPMAILSDFPYGHQIGLHKASLK